jgi:hypothetical protein
VRAAIRFHLTATFIGDKSFKRTRRTLVWRWALLLMAYQKAAGGIRGAKCLGKVPLMIFLPHQSE